MKNVGIAIVFLLGMAVAVNAEPLRLNTIPDDAKWLVHLNVDQMRDSTVVQRFYHECLAKAKDADKHFGKARERIGMDPRTDLHGITLYGSKICKNEGVLIVRAELDKELLLEKAEKAPDHEVVEYKDYKIHTWMHRRGEEKHTAAGAFFQDDVLVFGSSVDKVKKALDVLQGEAPSLEGKDTPLAEAVPQGAIFVARAVDLSEAEAPCKSPLVKKSKRVSLVKGESGGQWFVDGTLVTESEETAAQVKEILEGVRAMALLQEGVDEKMQELIRQVEVKVDGKTVQVTFRAPAEAVASKIEKVCDALAKMRKKHDKKD